MGYIASMTLGEKQRLFSRLIAEHILDIYASGYEVSLGDAKAIKRNPLEHTENSQHYQQCAIDLNLFKDGKYLSRTEDHAEFGKRWKAKHPLCRWGGDFPKPDGNHYEFMP